MLIVEDAFLQPPQKADYVTLLDIDADLSMIMITIVARCRHLSLELGVA